MFIPTTAEEVSRRGWKGLDIILVSGDTYYDSSYNGTAIIGHWLIENGFRVGIIAQPRTDSGGDITRLGSPELFWSVSSGSVDSMVANYTATKKFRKEDDFTPGGVNDRRPDRAVIAYSNLIKRYSKGKPVVLGGVEASLRRLAHYDFWSDSIRRSVLFDAKADVITYGMGEHSNLLLAQYMRDGKDWTKIKGLCRISKDVPEGYAVLPSYEECTESDDRFSEAFWMFYRNNDPVTASGLAQKHGDRYLIQNPPQPPLDQGTLDRVYGMDFENAVHPYYAKQGHVRAVDTVKNSITTHRGCYGECNFCSIAVMQGRNVVSRSRESILSEAERIASAKGFDGVIRDVGGPTANMYGFDCPKKAKAGACADKRCIYPEICRWMPVDHKPLIELLNSIKEVEGVRKVFVASGIRHDLVIADKEHGNEYLECLCRDHVSGQMKIAPEHVSPFVLDMMGKPGPKDLLRFKRRFDDINEKLGREQFLTYYMMAAHPGCGERQMDELSEFCRRELKTNPEQIQVFTPSPSTVSTLMYRTGRNWLSGEFIKSERSMQKRKKQKDAVLKARRR
ncbi:MAG: YgiQ family radical SAM protein [Thermoplasmatales archaeon]|nr:YgiQ family radical SAM protein [Thermoplasmatales archaeon]